MQMEKKGLLTTHYVIKLDVFKGWNFSLELKRGPIANENSLEAKFITRVSLLQQMQENV